MAQNLRTFLETASEQYQSVLNKSLLVVSVIGKDSDDWKKSDIVNNLCNVGECVGQIDSDNPAIFIEAYLSKEDSILYLILHGVHDLELQLKLFTSKDNKIKSFFEKIAKAEYEELSSLHLIFLLSHLVILVEQGRYFDTSYLKTFNDVNQMRISLKDKLVEELLRNPQLPKMWADYGRLSCPRMCFLYPDRCIRNELPLNKKKEIAEKLETGWESQIFNNLKHIRIVDTALMNCLIVLPEDVRYVHVTISPKEEPRDLIIDLLSRFLDGANPSKSEEDLREPSYCAFLKSAMQNILRYADKFKNFNCFPTLKEFIIGAYITYNVVMKDDKAIKLEEFIPELAIAQSIETTHWERAIHIYRTTCVSNGGCFSKSEHFNELDKALASVRTVMSGKNLEEALKKISETCNEYWKNGHQRCEAMSVTGHYCKNKIHEKELAHDSGLRYSSSCNCGKKQFTRVDPFTLKEANYDFYRQFYCCANLEAFKFPLFNPTTSAEPVEAVSPDDSERLESPIARRPNLHRRAKSTASESSKITDTAALSGVTIDDEEEIEDEEVDTVFDRFLDDDKLKELFLDEKDRSKFKRQETPLMDDDEEVSDEQEDEESIEGNASYLDTYDNDLKLGNQKSTQQYNYEKMLKQYKGQFLEHLPHSNAPPGFLPGFPSWALTIVGPANKYSHLQGCRLSGFKPKCDFLLPLDVFLKVNSKHWEEDLKKLNPRIDLAARSRRKPLGIEEEEGMNTEKIKFFVGFEYECPKGHRFFIEQPNKSVKAEKRGGPFAYKDEAKDLLDTDIPIWTPCTCRRSPLAPAQLMRLHIVTPKAPVVAYADIKVQPSSVNQNGYFFPHSEPLELSYNKYYILRLPFAYEGPNDERTYAPKLPKSCGRLFKNWFQAKHYRV